MSRAFGRVLTTKMALQCRAFTGALHREKLKSPLFHGPIGTVVTNGWSFVHKVSIGFSDSSHSEESCDMFGVTGQCVAAIPLISEK